ncbi:polysaccharide biosynthesis protein [bacterium]|nr:polysaccharide biosynthesis protein [bacterium]
MVSIAVPGWVRSLAVAARGMYPLPVMASDLIAFIPAFWFAGLLRNEVSSVTLDWLNVVQVAGIAIIAFLIVSYFLHLHRDRYRVGTFDEILALGFAWASTGVVAGVTNVLAFEPRTPTSVFGVGMMLVGMWMLATRAGWRLLVRSERRPDPEGRTRVLVFGAGEGGESVITSMLGDVDSRYVPMGLLDDDPRKQNRSIQGIRVLGTSADLASAARNADLLLIAIPSATASLIQKLSDEADTAGLEVRILPSTTELFGLMATIETARPLQIADLLGRDEVEVDRTSISNYLEGKVVLVTGAGGSIGSELCRQILRYKPERLVMVDRDETALQGVELSIDGHGLLNNDNLVLADIRDRDRVFEVFAQHRPSIVFHAAALKHLPLLEAHPREGLLTNVFGSKNVLDAASSIAVDHFVNISTDKAANPTSVLGTTKRLAEALTVETGRNASGDYISVRFGNVIGSRGSVLPAFEAQIAAGSPVTVTHPDITRYFMSIPEASRLVLQAGAIGSSGETLILDMGEPVKILDLAKKLIRHHKSDVEIVITGLRPNEKIHEELGHEGEVLETKNHKRIWHSQAVVVDVSDDLATLLAPGPRELAARLMDLAKATATSDNVKVHS